MSQLIAGISGIRGITGESLTPSTVLKYAPAFGEWCGGGPVVIGYDGRPSGIRLLELVRSALLFSGIDVIDTGMVPTPTVQFAVEHSNARGGIIVTASHNPEQWNGLKFLNEHGIFLDADENASFFELADRGLTFWRRHDGFGTLRSMEHAVETHIHALLELSIIDAPTIALRGFHVVVDAVNASGSVAIPELLLRLGCTVTSIACDASGVFPHTPEPLPENLVSLGLAVREHGADLGIAVDPDADRVVLYDERGEPFGEEYTIVTAVDAVLSRSADEERPVVAVNLSTTRAIDELAARYAARVVRSPVGEINVVRLMKSAGAIVGGEGSGGVILPMLHSGRDALVGSALALQALLMHDGPASSYRATLPQWVIRKRRYHADGVDIAALLQTATRIFADQRIDTQDGVRIDFEDGWVHLRASNTEPIVRIVAEGRSAIDADALADRVAEAVFPEHDSTQR
jgi:phosphomannomutase